MQLSKTNSIKSKEQFRKELMTIALPVTLPLAIVGTFVFNWPVMIVYIIVMSDEIIKIPWIYPRYKKYIWLKNLTKSNE